MAQVIGNKTFEESEEVEATAKEVIDEEDNLFLGNATIRYMKVYPEISKTTAGRCIKANKELKYFSDCDYIVEMSGDLWDNLHDDVKYVLMHHELMHIYVDVDDEGNDVYKMRDHDVMDFREIIERYGIDWLRTLQDSMNDLIPEDKQKVEGGIKL